jgi:hypothetical protein
MKMGTDSLYNLSITCRNYEQTPHITGNTSQKQLSYFRNSVLYGIPKLTSMFARDHHKPESNTHPDTLNLYDPFNITIQSMSGSPKGPLSFKFSQLYYAQHIPNPPDMSWFAHPNNYSSHNSLLYNTMQYNLFTVHKS